MRLTHFQQRWSCRKILVFLCVAVLVVNLFIFWPHVRSYADFVSRGYEVVPNKDNSANYERPPDPSHPDDSNPLKVPQGSKLEMPEKPEKTWLRPKEMSEKEKPAIINLEPFSKNRSLASEPMPEADDKRAGLPVCPDIPPKLVGDLRGKEEDVSPEQVQEEMAKDLMGSLPLQPGGKSQPAECRSRQKLAVIIPYRNRYAHLHILLNNLIPVLRRQQKDFQIFVMEQNMPTVFNRGMLFNVGFKEALKLGAFDCFVFHDVDMIPLNDNALYTCKDNPMHMAAWTSKWKGGIPYRSYFGGVVMFSKEQFEKINGDSNLYFGWGGEDDDLWARVKAKGYTPIRYPQRIARYRMIKHRRDHGNEDGKERFDVLKHGKQRIDIEGLNTAVYHVTEIKLLPLYTWIYASIDKDLILKQWNKDGTLKKTG